MTACDWCDTKFEILWDSEEDLDEFGSRGKFCPACGEQLDSSLEYELGDENLWDDE